MSLAFDFFFVPPRFNFAISDGQYLVTFAVMLIIALVIASLMANIRQQTRVAGARERRTALLYAMSRELAATRGLSSLAQVAVSHVAEVFQCKAVILLPDATGKLQYPRDPRLPVSFRHADLAVAQWVVDHSQRAGLGSDTLPAAPGLYLPLGQRARRAGSVAEQSTPRVAPGATPSAGDVCGPDRDCGRARPVWRKPRRQRASTPSGRACATRYSPPYPMTCGPHWP